MLGLAAAVAPRTISLPWGTDVGKSTVSAAEFDALLKEAYTPAVLADAMGEISIVRTYVRMSLDGPTIQKSHDRSRPGESAFSLIARVALRDNVEAHQQEIQRQFTPRRWVFESGEV